MLHGWSIFYWDWVLGFRSLEFRVDNNDDNNINFNRVNNYHKNKSMIYIYIDDIANAKLLPIYNT